MKYLSALTQSNDHNQSTQHTARHNAVSVDEETEDSQYHEQQHHSRTVQYCAPLVYLDEDWDILKKMLTINVINQFRHYQTHSISHQFETLSVWHVMIANFVIVENLNKSHTQRFRRRTKPLEV